MKVFLSWSGTVSNQLAGIFKEWLPNVLQYVDPYMSGKDISLGERWNNSIVESLGESVFGLIFVTPSNINAPWINYEAGALSKTFDSKVIPILYKSKVTILNNGPLKQFQSATNLEKESVLNLLKSVNESNKEGKLDTQRLEKAFEMWWPNLEESIKNVKDEELDKGTANEKEPTEKELLSVIYSKLNEQEKILNRTQPNTNGGHVYSAIVIADVENGYKQLRRCYKELLEGPYSNENVEEINAALLGLERVINTMKMRYDKRDLRKIIKI